MAAAPEVAVADADNPAATATVPGLAAEIEREFITIRTKEALAKCRADGIQLGLTHADLQAFDALMARKSGEPTRAGDVMPE